MRIEMQNGGLASDRLGIRRTPNGGYVVYSPGEHGFMSEDVFASTDIRDALDFIRDRLGPKPESIGQIPTEAGWEEFRDAKIAQHEAAERSRADSCTGWLICNCQKCKLIRATSNA